MVQLNLECVYLSFFLSEQLISWSGQCGGMETDGVGGGGARIEQQMVMDGDRVYNLPL